MAVVRLRAPLRAMAGGDAEQRLPGATVLDVLRALERAHPAVGGWILDERSAIRPHIRVWVNGTDGAAETEVGEDDRVDVLPAISGGWR